MTEELLRADIHLADNVRFVGGARLEVGSQTISSFPPYAPDDLDERTEGGTNGVASIFAIDVKLAPDESAIANG